MTRRRTMLALLPLMLLLAVWIVGRLDPRQTGASPNRLSASPVGSPAPGVPPLPDVPPGIQISLLANAETSDVPGGKLTLSLVRRSIPGKTSIELTPGSLRLIAVEQGRLIVTEGDKTNRYGAGTHLLVPAESSISLRNLDAASASLLELSLEPTSQGSTPIAVAISPGASPVARDTSTVLFSGDIGRLSLRHGTLFIALVDLVAGADTGRQTFGGPVGVAVEDGTIEIGGSSVAPLRIEHGRGVLLEAHTRQHARASADGPAVLLIAGLLPRESTGGIIAAPTVGPPTPALAATLQAERDGAMATAEALSTRTANLQVTVVALETDAARSSASARSAESTSIAEAEALSTARAAATEQSVIAGGSSTAIAAILTAEQARGAAMATEAAQLGATATTQMAALGAAAVAESESAAEITILEATIAALTTRSAVQESATVDAQSTAASSNAQLAATVTAQANSAATEAAARSASEVDATRSADLQASQAAHFASSATAVAASATAAAAQSISTIEALSTQLAVESGRANVSVDRDYVELSVQTDLDGVLAGDEPAIDQLDTALKSAFRPYSRAKCRAGVILTFGHGTTIGEGARLAEIANAGIERAATTLSNGAGFDSFGDLNSPPGQVDIRIYFFAGCSPAVP